MTSEDFAAKPPGRSGSRAILLIGLALGVVAAILVAVILSGDSGTKEKETVPATRIAVVAKQDIPARTRLSRDMLDVKTFSINDIDSDSFSAVSQVLNRVTSTDLVAGQVLVPDVVSATTGEGLTFSVDEGMRAISVHVSEVVIAGGNLSPGNFVDIVGIFTVPEAADVDRIVEVFTGEPFNEPEIVPGESTLTFTLVQNVKVLAVAQNLTPETAQSNNTNSDSSFVDTARPDPGAATVTLQVTPQQAQALVSADVLANGLRFAVRPFGDNEIVDVAPIIIYFGN